MTTVLAKTIGLLEVEWVDDEWDRFSLLLRSLRPLEAVGVCLATLQRRSEYAGLLNGLDRVDRFPEFVRASVASELLATAGLPPGQPLSVEAMLQLARLSPAEREKSVTVSDEITLCDFWLAMINHAERCPESLPRTRRKAAERLANFLAQLPEPTRPAVRQRLQPDVVGSLPTDLSVAIGWNQQFWTLLGPLLPLLTDPEIDLKDLLQLMLAEPKSSPRLSEAGWQRLTESCQRQFRPCSVGPFEPLQLRVAPRCQGWRELKMFEQWIRVKRQILSN